MRSNTVFTQLLQLICRYRFKKCVDHFEGDKYTKRFDCWQQLIVLLFAQAKGLDSLRDIEVSLRSHYRKWYHLGLTNFYQRKTYPASLRLVTYVDLKFQTKCRHSLHELTRIAGELLLDNVYLIETLTITFDEYKRIKSLQTQLSFW